MIDYRYIHLPVYFFLVILFYGIYLVFMYEEMQATAGRFNHDISNNRTLNLMLERTGIKITGRMYYLALYGLGVLIGIIGAIKAIRDANLGVFLLGFLIAFGFIWAFRPVEVLYSRITSPFAMVIKMLTKSRREKYDRELYSSCIVLKNLSIVQSESPLSADVMFEKLETNAKVLKPIYAQMISMYRTGRSEDAFKYFADAVGTSMGRTFAGLLSKIDRINPNDLKEQAIAIQEAMSEKRLTDGYRRAQRNGVITMGLSTVAVMAVMMDFLVVVVFMDMMNLLTFAF